MGDPPGKDGTNDCLKPLRREHGDLALSVSDSLSQQDGLISVGFLPSAKMPGFCTFETTHSTDIVDIKLHDDYRFLYIEFVADGGPYQAVE